MQTDTQTDRLLGNDYDSRRRQDDRLLFVDSQHAYYWESDKRAEIVMAVIKAAGVNPRTSCGKVNAYGVASSIMGRELNVATPRTVTITVRPI